MASPARIEHTGTFTWMPSEVSSTADIKKGTYGVKIARGYCLGTFERTRLEMRNPLLEPRLPRAEIASSPQSNIQLNGHREPFSRVVVVSGGLADARLQKTIDEKIDKNDSLRSVFEAAKLGELTPSTNRFYERNFAATEVSVVVRDNTVHYLLDTAIAEEAAVIIYNPEGREMRRVKHNLRTREQADKDRRIEIRPGEVVLLLTNELMIGNNHAVEKVLAQGGSADELRAQLQGHFDRQAKEHDLPGEAFAVITIPTDTRLIKLAPTVQQDQNN